MHSGDHWRDLAEEARTRAEDMKTDMAKKTMLAIADSYDEMAKRADLRQTKGTRQ